MAHRDCNVLRLRASRAAATWTAALAVLAGQAVRAAEAVQFIVPADRVSPSTVSVANPGPSAAPSTAAPSSVAPAIDMAALAAFAQALPEEIEAGEAEELRGFRPITQLSIDIALPSGAKPGDPGTELPGPPPVAWPRINDPRLWGGWADVEFTWSATRLCHRPLYFEQVNVERYGYTVSPVLQPAISGAHFFLTIPVLPYKMVVQPPRECIYTLGYYRAGSPAPRRWHHLTWDPTAATVEGFLATGLVFLIP